MYPAQVIGMRGEKSLVHDVGFEASWYQRVVAGRIREPHITDIPRGSRVRVLWTEDEEWHRGTVLASRLEMHEIRCDGYSHEWADWVPSDSIEQLGE